MDVLVIGGGGREHAIVWAFKKSPKVNKIYALPGNAGIEEIAECENISVMDFENILKFLEAHKNIDLVFVAPDDPLAGGLVDFLEDKGYRVFGPRKNAAIIEGSKSFAKKLMKKYGIPTASYEEFTDYEKALSYVEKQKCPIVIKADGLALGKGVIIAENIDEAKQALYDMMVNETFKEAGKKVIIEEFLKGKEVTVLSFCDGKTIIPMVSSQDHKRAYDNDEGLNTGGMGTFSPSQCYTKQMEDYVYNNIMLKTVDAMNKEGRTFKGVLYFGLMITDDGVKVLEYNARFGDPETQVILPRLDSDFTDIVLSVIEGKLDKADIRWKKESAVCVILASGGYPKNYKKGLEIKIGDIDKDILLFHAGTKKGDDGKLLTNGGRVIGVTALGSNIDEARKKAYKNIEKIYFENMHFRKDIGIKL